MSKKHQVMLFRTCGTSCTIYLNGGYICSWIYKGEEQLFVSKKSQFICGGTVTGGISLEFPFQDQGNSPKPLTKSNVWSLKSGPTTRPNGDVEVVLTLEDDECTREVWPNEFIINYVIVLTEKEIRMCMSITNLSEKPFEFNYNVNTYLKLEEVSNLRIIGLTEISAESAELEGGENVLQKPEETEIKIEGMIDETFKHSSDEFILIKNDEVNRKIRLEKFGLPDTKLWNPGEGESSEIFEPEEYKNMISLKTGFDTPILLDVNKSYQCKLVLRVLCVCPMHTYEQSLKSPEEE